jgi:hypothetical protein
MVNNKGWLRIVEATVCTLIILGVIIFIYRTNAQTNESYSSAEMHLLLDEVAKNDILRHEIINSSNNLIVENDINDFLENKIKNRNLNFTSRICNVNEETSCALGIYFQKQKEIYTESRIISTYLNNTIFNSTITPKKIKIYVWER